METYLQYLCAIMKTSITKDIVHCQRLLRDNKLVAIPTETVYGLAANIFNEDSIREVFEMKGRPLFNPLIVHIHSMGQLRDLAKDIPQKAKMLMNEFWPGPLTLVLPKTEKVSQLITAGKTTVAVRMPNHPITRRLLQGLDFPIAAPSANPFTKVSPTSAEHVAAYFGDAIPAILDGGLCEVGLESTIVGFDGENPIVYRKGGISIADIENCVGELSLLVKEELTPVAPGMLLKHYSPNTKLIISDNVSESVQDNQEKAIGVLSFYESNFPNVRCIKILSDTKNMGEAAKNLYAALHELDRMRLDLIIAQRFPETGLGISINDRLERAQS